MLQTSSQAQQYVQQYKSSELFGLSFCLAPPSLASHPLNSLSSDIEHFQPQQYQPEAENIEGDNSEAENDEAANTDDDEADNFAVLGAVDSVSLLLVGLCRRSFLGRRNSLGPCC